MTRTGSSESALTATAGAAGRHATEAFALLGNETRLAILLAPCEEHDPHADDNAVPFSRILNRLDYDDPGNLRYHLEKLRGQFVQQHAEGEGYELREPGMKLVRTVIAGAGAGETTMAPAGIDQPCLLCGAPTTTSYCDGCLFWACTECEGPTPEVTDVDGFLSATPFEPAGLTDRQPQEIRLASIANPRHKLRLMFDGFCPDCSGSVESWLEVCPDHNPAGICEHCGKRYAVWVRFQCRVCKRHGVSSPKILALLHPAVVAFYENHGLSVRVQADDFESARRIFERTHDHEMELVSTESPTVIVSVRMDGDEIHLTFDETASVVEVSSSSDRYAPCTQQAAEILLSLEGFSRTKIKRYGAAEAQIGYRVRSAQAIVPLRTMLEGTSSGAVSTELAFANGLRGPGGFGNPP